MKFFLKNSLTLRGGATRLSPMKSPMALCSAIVPSDDTLACAWLKSPADVRLKSILSHASLSSSSSSAPPMSNAWNNKTFKTISRNPFCWINIFLSILQTTDSNKEWDYSLFDYSNSCCSISQQWTEDQKDLHSLSAIAPWGWLSLPLPRGNCSMSSTTDGCFIQLNLTPV